MIRLILPIPPSANGLFRNPPRRGMRRPLTEEYKAWRWYAHVALKGHVYDPIVSGKWRMTLRLPRAMRGDCSNRIKAIEDFLVAHKITPDDRHDDHPEALRDDDVPMGKCIVEVESIPSPAAGGADNSGNARKGGAPSTSSPIRQRRHCGGV